MISFKVDPGRLPAAVGVAHATSAGLYIQIYEPALATWIPLRPTYHPASHTVTATAPHLSLVGLVWGDLTCAVTCPAKFIAKLVKRLGSDVVSNLKQAWSPKQEPDECPGKADKNWAVRSTIKQLSGCVIDAPAPVVQVENPLLLPMAIRQPLGAPHSSLSQQPSIAGGHPELLKAVSYNLTKQQETAVGPVLTFVDALDSAYECANDKLGKDLTDGIQRTGMTNGVFEAAANLAQTCVETTLGVLGKELNHSFKDVLDVLDSFPNFGKTIREGVQFAELGPSAMLAATTAERVPYDLTKSPYFQTPAGNISCGVPFFTWWPHTPSEPSYIRDAVECRIVNNTVEPTSCHDLPFEATPAAYMEPGEYASFTCVQREQDKPMDFLYAPNSGLTISLTGPRIVCGGWFFTELHIDDPGDAAGSGGVQIAPDSYSPGRPGSCLPPSSG